MRSKRQYTDYLPSFDDTVGIHDKISRNCIEKRTITGLPRTSWSWHTRGTKFSRTCWRDVRGIQIVLAWRIHRYVFVVVTTDIDQSSHKYLHTNIPNNPTHKCQSTKLLISKYAISVITKNQSKLNKNSQINFIFQNVPYNINP